MNLKQIQDLIQFVADSGVHEVEIEKEGFKIRVRTTESNSANQNNSLPANSSPKTKLVEAVTTYSSEVSNPAPETVKPEVTAAQQPLITVKSPMIGTFYRSSAPDKETFVNVGDVISPGKVICIIEAMKLFNEIESEVSGKIVKILVENASPVEYDQPIMLVEAV